MIRDLEEGRSELHPRRGSQQARALGLKDEKVKAEIVSLGTTWSLVSRHTSFVAVEEHETPTQGDAQLRKVPVAITRGWHGLGQARPLACAPRALACAVPVYDAPAGASLEDREMVMDNRQAFELGDGDDMFGASYASNGRVVVFSFLGGG